MVVVAEFKEKANPNVEHFQASINVYFLRNLGQSKSHGQSQIQSGKYTSPLSRRSCKIKWLSIQIWEEFVTIITTEVLQSTTFYVIATYNEN